MIPTPHPSSSRGIVIIFLDDSGEVRCYARFARLRQPNNLKMSRVKVFLCQYNLSRFFRIADLHCFARQDFESCPQALLSSGKIIVPNGCIRLYCLVPRNLHQRAGCISINFVGFTSFAGCIVDLEIKVLSSCSDHMKSRCWFHDLFCRFCFVLW